MSLNYLATRFTCSWPWDILVMLCDGRMVCGCADPYGHRVLGDARATSVGDIWTGPLISRLREELNHGGSSFCGDCPLKLPLKKDQVPTARSIDAGRLPARMFIECTAACNISCAGACCAPETGITRTRQAGMLDFELFRRVIDEVGPSLNRVDFFNYGEAFLHKRAIEMCEYIKTSFPHIYLYTSTNGLAFSEAEARRLAHSGIDEVTFSIDGATAEQLRASTGNAAGSTSRSRTCARWLTKSAPPAGTCPSSTGDTSSSPGTTATRRWTSRGSSPPTPAWTVSVGKSPITRRTRTRAVSCRVRSTSRPSGTRSGTTTISATPFPGRRPRARIDVRTLVPGLPLMAHSGRVLRVRTRVRNLSTQTLPG